MPVLLFLVAPGSLDLGAATPPPSPLGLLRGAVLLLPAPPPITVLRTLVPLGSDPPSGWAVRFHRHRTQILGATRRITDQRVVANVLHTIQSSIHGARGTVGADARQGASRLAVG